ncbi:hypothetical protein JAAARDRAFT_55117 [Jaapia argillacea MUCL 33604]|uniref:Uncharacterized protein n=1 Tax=Jaapia argillacea MUCL 33604 TaxID=933084 RepID=A0A067QE42_9AGAM|nr:hypothetical protein JAAARDRAFT_55117 [Jaapia argillacea MUCL 33604]
MAEFYYADDLSDLTIEERMERAFSLPSRLQDELERLDADRAALSDRRQKVEQLVQDINEIHPRLQENLRFVLATLYSGVHEKHLAESELLASTIETSIIKLALIRARAQTSLYEYTIPSSQPSRSEQHSQATMSAALSALHQKLIEEEEELDDEEKVLDAEMDEYQKVLCMAEGRDGGFRQVVEDMARVRRENEECRRDLRRLGWTGD